MYGNSNSSYQQTNLYTPITTSSSNVDLNNYGFWYWGAARSDRMTRRKVLCLASLGLGILVVALLVLLPMKHQRVSRHLVTDHDDTFDAEGRYIIEDFDTIAPFANFLAGVAGIWGKPLWVFYVNRGQAIASFGTKSKNYPILEYNSANKAYQNTPFIGFRTFIQGFRQHGRYGRKVPFLLEPFDIERAGGITEQTDDDILPKRTMFVGKNDLEIVELDERNDIKTSVTYFNLAEEPFASLVRRAEITNIHNSDTLHLTSVLDGLAKIEPYGGEGELNGYLKNMGRTLEGWMLVAHADGDSLSLPFYRLSSSPNDTADVHIETKGNFCFSYLDSNPSELLPIVFDTNKVFGFDTSLAKPRGLSSSSVKEILNSQQNGNARTSSAFAAAANVTLRPGESVVINSFYGQVDRIEDLPKVARLVQEKYFVRSNMQQGRKIVSMITGNIKTETSSKLFDEHVQQMYLDNALRGGVPLIVGKGSKEKNVDQDDSLKVLHTFSRIHGDLERDYNDFEIDGTYYSQGPGNFRDVAQNRRLDVMFEPRIGTFDVTTFLSFIQPDGYNPLSVEGIIFILRNPQDAVALASDFIDDSENTTDKKEAFAKILSSGPTRPGQIFELMEQQGIKLKGNRDSFIEKFVSLADYEPLAQFKDGFWSDHWTYILDLIKAYIMVYPDGEEALLYDKTVDYFFSPATVKPRDEKYIVDKTYDGTGYHVRQLDACREDHPKKVDAQMIYLNSTTGLLAADANWYHGIPGTRFQSKVIEKLCLIGVLKFANRDCYGMGIEYEGGKPGWNDAMNGLVAMLGSGMPETFELVQLLDYLQNSLSKYDIPIDLPIELASLIMSIGTALDDLEASGYSDGPDLKYDVPNELFAYWDSVATAKERYRKRVDLAFDGATKTFSATEVFDFFDRCLDHIGQGIARALRFGSSSGETALPPTYFAYNVTSWILTNRTNEKGHDLVHPRALSVIPLPLFLEGPVKMMKMKDDFHSAKDIYSNILSSVLNDKPLGMYTISENLEGFLELGRIAAFAPGWLENQSVWSHMSYKFYLEIIRHKLSSVFFSEMKSGGFLPFVNKTMYGRPVTECSSFLPSSIFEDNSMRGKGFLARLTGATAEFLNIWVLMFIGPKPFFIADDDSHDLQMQLLPTLPLWLFKGSNKTEENVDSDLQISFKLFSAINVTYHNLAHTNLDYKAPPTEYIIKFKNNTVSRVFGPVIPNNLAIEIREVVNVESIDAYFRAIFS